MLKCISVERAAIATNRALLDSPYADLLPTMYIEVFDNVGIRYWAITAYEVEIPGESRLIYRPHNFEPGDPNAHVWIETTEPIKYATSYGGACTEEIL